jgi:hypothetical protein
MFVSTESYLRFAAVRGAARNLEVPGTAAELGQRRPRIGVVWGLPDVGEDAVQIALAVDLNIDIAIRGHQ